MRDITGEVMRNLLAGLLLVVAVAALAVLAGVPYAADPAQHGVLRLAWRARGERVQRCRRLSAEELAKLPVHMRPPNEEVCERGITPYRLRVSVDDSLAVDELVRAGGAESDRPLFVFHELAVPPGVHHLSLVFAREDDRDVKNQGNADEEFEDRQGRDLRETPRHLTLDETVTVAPRAIVLVTYDDERRHLHLLAAPGVRP